MNETSTPQTAAEATRKIKSLLTKWELPKCVISTRAFTVSSESDHARATNVAVWSSVVEPATVDPAALAAELVTVHEFLAGRTEFTAVTIVGDMFVSVQQRR